MGTGGDDPSILLPPMRVPSADGAEPPSSSGRCTSRPLSRPSYNTQAPKSSRGRSELDVLPKQTTKEKKNVHSWRKAATNTVVGGSLRPRPVLSPSCGWQILPLFARWTLVLQGSLAAAVRVPADGAMTCPAARVAANRIMFLPRAVPLRIPRLERTPQGCRDAMPAVLACELFATAERVRVQSTSSLHMPEGLELKCPRGEE